MMVNGSEHTSYREVLGDPGGGFTVVSGVALQKPGSALGLSMDLLCGCRQDHTLNLGLSQSSWFQATAVQP